MSEVEPDALADVAYGLFEHMLNTRLRELGPYLFELVEGEIDFQSTFCMIFEEFRSVYPEIADALMHQFGSIDAIYALIQAGEGVIPSKTTRMYWIIQDAPGVRPDAIEDELAGKWLIFLPPNRWMMHGGWSVTQPSRGFSVFPQRSALRRKTPIHATI